jgi:DMSO/TMAO reductase YedYZ molybdopterin-dependent catalytic subunit
MSEVPSSAGLPTAGPGRDDPGRDDPGRDKLGRDKLGHLRDLLGRRRLLGRSLSLGALTLLTGCDISDGDTVQQALAAVSRWNDGVQAALFGSDRLAREFAPSALAAEDRYNAYYAKADVPKLDADTYRLTLAGAIGDKRPWRVANFADLPQVSQITRHICVEGWSYVGQWGGPTLASFLHRVGADTTARYVGYECADGYYGGMDMQTALHPQTLIALTRRGETLQPEFGYPFKIRIPTKLGFKNPKFITTLFVTDRRPPGFWEDRGYNWFSGL